jgi:hypothetical protein
MKWRHFFNLLVGVIGQFLFGGPRKYRLLAHARTTGSYAADRCDDGAQ